MYQCREVTLVVYLPLGGEQGALRGQFHQRKHLSGEVTLTKMDEWRCLQLGFQPVESLIRDRRRTPPRCRMLDSERSGVLFPGRETCLIIRYRVRKLDCLEKGYVTLGIVRQNQLAVSLAKFANVGVTNLRSPHCGEIPPPPVHRLLAFDTFASG